MSSSASALQDKTVQRPVLTKPKNAAKTGNRVASAAVAVAETVMPMENRAHPRVAIRGLIELVWRDPKQRIRSMQALARNVSKAGALVSSYRALPVGSFVRLRSSELYFLSGCARVQHCKRAGLLYRIGLKFYAQLPERYS
jgi:hypothetical protein